MNGADISWIRSSPVDFGPTKRRTGANLAALKRNLSTSQTLWRMTQSDTNCSPSTVNRLTPERRLTTAEVDDPVANIKRSYGLTAVTSNSTAAPDHATNRHRRFD